MVQTTYNVQRTTQEQWFNVERTILPVEDVDQSDSLLVKDLHEFLEDLEVEGRSQHATARLPFFSRTDTGNRKLYEYRTQCNTVINEGQRIRRFQEYRNIAKFKSSIRHVDCGKVQN